MPATGKSAVHPVPLIFFLAVVSLIADYRAYGAAGESGPLVFLLVSAVLAALVGWIVGRRWPLYPWQIGVLGAIPAILYVIWRFISPESVQDPEKNLGFFIYHPLLVIVSGHFGGLIGRWQALKARARNAKG